MQLAPLHLGGDDKDDKDEEDDDELNPEDIPATNAALTALRVTLAGAEVAWDNALKRFIKLWVTRDPSKTGRLFFFTVAGVSCIFGANLLGPENPLEFGRDNLFSSVMGGTPEWVFNREQGGALHVESS
jgi:hypothetical protein